MFERLQEVIVNGANELFATLGLVIRIVSFSSLHAPVDRVHVF